MWRSRGVGKGGGAEGGAAKVSDEARVQVVVEKPVEVIKVVEKPVEVVREVEKIVFQDRPVEKIVEVEVEKVVYQTAPWMHEHDVFVG